MSRCSQIALNLNQDDKSIFYHQIDDGGGETSKNITLANITDELISTGLIGTVPSAQNKKNELIDGVLSGSDYDETCQNAKEVINEYYRLYLKDERIKHQWDLGRGDGGFINSNTGIRVTLRLLGYMCRYEKLQKYDLPKKIIEKLEKYKEEISEGYLARFGYKYDQVIAHSNFDFMPLGDMYACHQEYPMGNLIADSYRYEANQNGIDDIDVYLVGLGTIRGSFSEGDIDVPTAFQMCSLGVGADGSAGHPLLSAYIVKTSRRTRCITWTNG